MSVVSLLSSLAWLFASWRAFRLVREADLSLRAREATPNAGHESPNQTDVRLGYAFFALTAAVFIWLFVYPYKGDLASAVAYAAVAWAVTCLALYRRAAARRFEAWWEHRALSRWVGAEQVLLALVALTAVAAMELPWNRSFPIVAPQALLVELALVLLAVEGAWNLALRHATAAFVVLVACGVAGIVGAFILDFRGTVVSFGDIYALRTAAAVRTGYAYQLNGHMLSGIAMGLVGAVPCLLLSALGKSAATKAEDTASAAEASDGPEASTAAEPVPEAQAAPAAGVHHMAGLTLAGRLVGWHRPVAWGIACAAALVAGVILPDYQHQLGIRVDYRSEQQLADHRTYLFLPSLVAEAQGLPISRPAGYSRAAADAAEADLAALYDASGAWSARAQAQFAETQPSVIIVMNETFCDLTAFFDDLGGYTGPAFFSEGLDDVLARGELAVSVNGGGTCNTEFELLTGQSMAFVGSNKYPYTLYDLADVPSLPHQFAVMGYETCAIHPNLATNWGRDEVYEDLGFDRFVSIDDFDPEARQFHNTVSDTANYDMVLDILAESDAPQLIFDVTMQNHGGYDQGGIPEYLLNRFADYGPSDLDEETRAQLAEYLACIDESDRALRSFVAKLRDLDRPVVLVFFGDHQAAFTPALNALVSDESAAAHEERLYQSNYLVWANYDVAGVPTAAEDAAATRRNASASDLAATALSLVGAPITSAQRAQLGAQQLVTQLNLFGYRTSSGIWRSLDELRNDPSGTANAVRELRLISYRDFGCQV